MTLIVDSAHRNQGRPTTAGTHVLIIGVGKYPHMLDFDPLVLGGQVDSAARGAAHIAQWFKDEFRNLDCPLQTVRLLSSGGLPPGEVQKQFGADILSATWPNLSQAYDEWVSDGTAVKDSNMIFYFAGHGYGNADNQCLLLEDFNLSKQRPHEGAFSLSNLVNSVAVLRQLKSAWFFVDACRSSSLTEVATDSWGQKVNSKLLPLSVSDGPPCALICSAAPGHSALGITGQPTFFAKALHDAFSLNGYCEDGENWVVRADRIQTSLSVNLIRHYEASGVSPGDRPRSQYMVEDPMAILHTWSGELPPYVLVKVTCAPQEDNLIHTLSLRAAQPLVEDEPRQRPPAPEVWYEFIRPGQYIFEAIDAAGEVVRFSQKSVYAYLEIGLKK